MVEIRYNSIYYKECRVIEKNSVWVSDGTKQNEKQKTKQGLGYMD